MKEEITLNKEELFLKAVTYEEIDIISSLLQDSIFSIDAHAFSQENRCFFMLINRFCWETQNTESIEKYERTHSGLYIHNVNKIIGNMEIKKHKKEHFLNILAIYATGNEVNIIFSENKHIIIETEKICVYLKDIEKRWSTKTAPAHT